MKLWWPHCLNSWSVIVVRPRHADAVLSCGVLVVRARWKLWKKSYGMPKQHARHWTQSVSSWWAHKYSTLQNASERRVLHKEGGAIASTSTYYWIYSSTHRTSSNFSSHHIFSHLATHQMFSHLVYIYIFVSILCSESLQTLETTADESWSGFAVCFACNFDGGFDELVRSSAPSFGGVWSKWRSSNHTANHAPQAFCWVCFAKICTCFCRLRSEACGQQNHRP